VKVLYQNKLGGFSLIETAFCLLIAGITTSITFSYLETAQRLERQKLSISHQKQIFHALAGYVLKSYRLPLPSTPERAGKEGESCHGKDQGVCIGILPYQELGLSESMARDGHGRWFTYVIDKNLELTHGGINEISRSMGSLGIYSQNLGDTECFCRVNSSGLKLKSLADVPVLNERLNKDFIAVLLISHGSKGTGAFHETINKRLPVSESHEQQNTTVDTLFAVRTSQDSNTTFSHDVYWVTRNNLMALYGNHPCQPSLADSNGFRGGNPIDQEKNYPLF
jgi:hypothetical protein